MVLDSNIVIYTRKPEFEFLQDFIVDNSCGVSASSHVEVLGFHRLTQEERVAFEETFDKLALFPLSSDVVEQAVKLRQQKKMSLGESPVTATALVYDLPLVTRNTDDFKWIANLTVINPFNNIP